MQHRGETCTNLTFGVVITYDITTMLERCLSPSKLSDLLDVAVVVILAIGAHVCRIAVLLCLALLCCASTRLTIYRKRRGDRVTC